VNDGSPRQHGCCTGLIHSRALAAPCQCGPRPGEASQTPKCERQLNPANALGCLVHMPVSVHVKRLHCGGVVWDGGLDCSARLRRCESSVSRVLWEQSARLATTAQRAGCLCSNFQIPNVRIPDRMEFTPADLFARAGEAWLCNRVASMSQSVQTSRRGRAGRGEFVDVVVSAHYYCKNKVCRGRNRLESLGPRRSWMCAGDA
jgi:hypothetical protein